MNNIDFFDGENVIETLSIDLKVPFNSSVSNPFETMSALLAPNSSTSQVTDAYFPLRVPSSDTPQTYPQVPLPTQWLIYTLPQYSGRERKSQTRIQCKWASYRKVVQNRGQHRFGVEHHCSNIRVVKRDKLVDPVEGELCQDVFRGNEVGRH